MKRIGNSYSRGPQQKTSVPGGGSPLERLWLTMGHLGIIAGLVVAFFTWGVGVSLAAVLALSMASWIVLLVSLDEDQPASALSLVQTALVSGITIMAGVSGLHGLHWVGAALILSLVLSAPQLWRWLRKIADRSGIWSPPTHDGAESQGSESPTRAGAPPPAEVPATLPGEGLELDRFDPTILDDDVLCLAWRTSFVHLQAARSVPARLRLVQRRQTLLDELSRRHEQGVACWLAAGARAASNPRPFLDRGRLSQPDL
jgi:hypothetical protein